MAGLFTAWQEWRERREILKTLRRQEGDDSERIRFKVKDELTYALQALHSEDRKQAVTLWESLIQRYPRDTRDSKLALDVLLGLGRLDEAEELMRAGRQAHPGDPHFAKGLLEVAMRRGSAEDTITHAAELRKRFPGVVEGYSIGAKSLEKLGRFSEAEELTRQAMNRFPNSLLGFMEYAHLASTQENWEEACKRWQVCADRFADFTAGYLGRAEALNRLGRHEEAEALLAETRTRFPTDAWVLVEIAKAAQMRGDETLAIERWNRLMERIPMYIHGYSLAAAAFETMAKPADAEAALRAAVDRFPLEPGPSIELGKLFQARHDFKNAAEAWTALRKNFPDNEDGYIFGSHALQEAGFPDEAAAVRREQAARFADRS